MKKKILILAGGYSKEREISIKTARAVQKQINKDFTCKVLDPKNGFIKEIRKFKPNIIGIEKTFVGEGNISSLKLGMARGVCLLVAAKTNISIRELAPKLVKKSVTGSGNADKQQVNSMIKILLGKKPVNDDSSDALAIAITANNHEGCEENSDNSSKYNLNRAIQKALQNQR